MLQFTLEIDGDQVATANGGMEGLEVAREFRPDVAFVDIMMPGLDGHAVASAMRRDLGSGVWIIALRACSSAARGAGDPASTCTCGSPFSRARSRRSSGRRSTGTRPHSNRSPRPRRSAGRVALKASSARAYTFRARAFARRLSGVWRSPVAHLLWEQGVGGSNPLTPTSLTFAGGPGGHGPPVRLSRRPSMTRRRLVVLSLVCGARLGASARDQRSAGTVRCRSRRPRTRSSGPRR